MNKIRSITYIALRTYARSARNKRASAASSKELDINPDVYADFEKNFLEDEDLAQFDADFFNVDKFYDEYEREKVVMKEQLKRRIVVGKYFKQEQDPSFLTFMEREEIKKLHESNPEEWTPERLSEGFPALPDVIKKIIKSKWQPKSVERALNYDMNVIENWKKFKIGKLPVSPALKKHLMKFKDRKINVTGREILAQKVARPPPEFPKPKSNLFSSIITSYIEDKDTNTDEQKALPSNDTKKEQNVSSMLQSDNKKAFSQADISSRNDRTSTLNRTKSVALIDEKTNGKGKNERLQTFDEFAKDKLQKLYEQTPEEGVTLLHTYIQYKNTYDQKEDKDTEIVKPNKTLKTEPVNKLETTESTNDDIKRKKELNVLDKPQDSNKSIATKVTTTQSNLANIDANKKSALDTYVKEWNIMLDEGENFDMYIKVPRKLYKKGMLYRISDCYYDDDGEFLYRVPCLKK